MVLMVKHGKQEKDLMDMISLSLVTNVLTRTYGGRAVERGKNFMILKFPSSPYFMIIYGKRLIPGSEKSPITLMYASTRTRPSWQVVRGLSQGISFTALNSLILPRLASGQRRKPIGLSGSHNGKPGKE